jgi:hypothetical protein
VAEEQTTDLIKRLREADDDLKDDGHWSISSVDPEGKLWAEAADALEGADLTASATKQTIQRVLDYLRDAPYTEIKRADMIALCENLLRG